MKVVFILGSGHCGSTLLDLLLDGHPKVRGVGEMSNLGPDKVCTCGKEAHACPFWSKVAGAELAVPQQVYRPKLAFLFGSSTFRLTSTRRAVDAARLCDLIIGMYERMGADIVVDSSKSVDRAELLSGDSRIEPVVIHLVRDCRAVTWAYVRKYRRDWPFFFKWFAENVKVEIFKRRFGGRVLLVRYENLANNPERQLRRICGALGIAYDPAMLDFRSGERHQIAGNRMRFGADTTIRRDDSWRADMPLGLRLSLAVCFGWLNARYRGAGE